MQRIISLIIAKDENNQDILMNIEVDEDLDIQQINLAGYLFSQEEIASLQKKLKVQKELFEALKDNEPLDITHDFKNMSKEQILQNLSAA